MGVVDHGGVKINYRCVGSGKDIVFVHGLAANQAFWNPLAIQTLARSHRVTVFDLRGHGYSSMPPSGYTSADMSRDLGWLLDYLDISTAHIVGHSFGGLVTLQYVISQPHRVDSLTLADVRVRLFQPTQRAQDWPSRESTKRMLDDCGLTVPQDVEEAGLWILEKLASPEFEAVRETLRKRKRFSLMGKSKRFPEQWLKLLRETTARQDILKEAGLTREKISSITQPVMGIYGEDSPVLPSLHGLGSVLPNFETVIIPEGGHFFPMGRPKLFAQWVKKFVGTVEQGWNTRGACSPTCSDTPASLRDTSAR